MLSILTAMVFSAFAARSSADHIELDAVKRWAVTVSLHCGSRLGPDMAFDDKRLTVDHQGFRLHFRRHYGGLRLLFPMLESPGTPIGNEDVYGAQKSAHLESFKSLARIFREIDPRFADFHIDAGRGFTYRKNESGDDPYGTIAWNGFSLDWLHDRLTYPEGETKILSESATELVRLLFRANGRPVTFQNLFDHIYPGRRDAVRPAIMSLRHRLKQTLDHPRLRLRVDEEREHFTLFVPK